MDVEDIPYGGEFREYVRRAIADSDCVVAVIGPRWLGTKGGADRIGADDDPVRLEIEAALQKGVPVIPVLAGKTRMPEAGRLPETMRQFAYLNCAPLDPGQDFHPHMDRIIHSIESLASSGNKSALGGQPAPSGPEQAARPATQFVRSADGVRLAWRVSGHRKPPLIATGHWLTHLDHEWANPMRAVIGDAMDRSGRMYIRYDARGNGLSDWEVEDISLDRFVDDLEAVVDAAGAGQFVLLGVSQGAPVSVAYAVRHPERVARLIMIGGFAKGGLKRAPEEREQRQAMGTLMRMGWNVPDSSFRQLFTSRLMPGASKEQADIFNDLQRNTTSAECAVRYYEAVSNFDVSDLLAQVKVPTLVLHARGDLANPFDEGRRVAADIAGAHFVALQSDNHVLLPGEPAAARFIEEVERFIGE